MQSRNIKSDHLLQIPLYTIWLCPRSSMVISSPPSLIPFLGMLLILITSLESITWTATSLPPLTSHLSTTHWCPPLCKCATLKSHLQSLKTPYNQKEAFMAFDYVWAIVVWLSHSVPVAQWLEHCVSSGFDSQGTHVLTKTCIAWMQCKSLWIKASAKCLNVNVC